jgi:hypothetical protein
MANRRIHNIHINNNNISSSNIYLLRLCHRFLLCQLDMAMTHATSPSLRHYRHRNIILTFDINTTRIRAAGLLLQLPNLLLHLGPRRLRLR